MSRTDANTEKTTGTPESARPDHLHWDVFVTPGIPIVTRDKPPGVRETFFQSTASTLIYGVRDAVLVDAFMTVTQANALADWVAARGKNLQELPRSFTTRCWSCIQTGSIPDGRYGVQRAQSSPESGGSETPPMFRVAIDMALLFLVADARKNAATSAVPPIGVAKVARQS